MLPASARASSSPSSSFAVLCSSFLFLSMIGKLYTRLYADVCGGSHQRRQECRASRVFAFRREMFARSASGQFFLNHNNNYTVIPYNTSEHFRSYLLEFQVLRLDQYSPHE